MSQPAQTNGTGHAPSLTVVLGYPIGYPEGPLQDHQPHHDEPQAEPLHAGAPSTGHIQHSSQPDEAGGHELPVAVGPAPGSISDTDIRGEQAHVAGTAVTGTPVLQ
jgi:hypothetical protein